jgi:hypothetical protein
MKNQHRPNLTEREIQEPYAEFYNRGQAKIPSMVIDDILNSPYPEKEALLFENINELLNPGYLPLETGYCKMPDGSVFVAVLTEMPDVTGDMLDWWFWWHPINPLRYKIWYPETHLGTKLDVDMEEYISRSGPYNQRYWNTANYPVEDIGVGKDTLSIRFIPPYDFGFDISRFETAGVATAICGIVGSISKKIRQHTYMCHFVRNKNNGVEMRSRFWIGHTVIRDGVSEKSIINRLINTKFARKILLPKKVGFCMAMHCAQEYNNLAKILPELYETYANDHD